jgi:hypothetical protein
MYNPDYIDDRECREARRIEREVMNELSWLIQKETHETRELSEIMRTLSRRIYRPDYNEIPSNKYALPNINPLAEIAKYRREHAS